jgi:hypothetical protein
MRKRPNLTPHHSNLHTRAKIVTLVGRSACRRGGLHANFFIALCAAERCSCQATAIKKLTKCVQIKSVSYQKVQSR